MPDWPSAQIGPQSLTVGSFSDTSLCWDLGLSFGTTASGGGVWPAANRAIYIPFWIEQVAVAQKIAFRVQVQSGNVDVGIYDEKGNRLVSSGSTAVAVAGLQVIDITDTTLNPGTYFIAMAVDNGTANINRCSSMSTEIQRLCGVQEQASAFALPSTATFATPSSAYVPAVVASLTATI